MTRWRPRLLDLFSGAGGAGMGYHRAGFDVTGVDIKAQPRYPFRHIVGDALEYCRAHGREYDVIHASPPCQRYSRTTKQSGTSWDHPDMIADTRAALIGTGVAYVIENVADAAAWLRDPFMLCGGMFPGLRTYRHRLFESSVFLLAPSHQVHAIPTPRSNVYIEGCFMTVYGHVSPVWRAREVMGIDWPMTAREVVNAIPPAYTEWIGCQLLAALDLETERVA